MKNKYYNDAIIGNDKILVSFSKTGEMLRLFYPNRDSRQFIDCMHTGIKVNDSSLIYLHEDINNQYDQYYTEDTNILNTKIRNTYFNLSILQTDCVSIEKDVVIKKYILKNENNIDLNVNFLVYSNLLSNFNNMVGTKIENDIFMQYSHDYTYCIFSKSPILSHRLNNSEEEIKTGVISDKDYIGMANDSAISFDIGILKPGEEKEFEIFIYINDNKKIYKFDEIIENVEKIKKIDTKKEIKQVEKYWKTYIKNHDGLEIISKQSEWEKKIAINGELNEKSHLKYEAIKKIYIRTILLFPLLLNKETGGISAAVEVDEKRDKSGRYSYCWPRDAVFITNALDILNMKEETTKFYKIFSKETQSKNGMWEQRFYTDGRLAPCWGYQIDETASIVYGVYNHFNYIKDKEFLKESYEMCKSAIKFLKGYIDYILLTDEEKIQSKDKDTKKIVYKYNDSYDLWEMSEGIHLYSLSSIYAAFKSMIEINKELNINDQDNKNLEAYSIKVKEFCLNNLYCKETNTLKRSNKDKITDISILGIVEPFKMFDAKDEKILNTIRKMELTLRTYKGGYLRFENDNYIEGNNPWTIATLWMSLYRMKIGEREEAIRQIEYIAQTATKNGLLAEQIDNEMMQSKWVIGLGWSHAMYIIALYNLNNYMKD